MNKKWLTVKPARIFLKLEQIDFNITFLGAIIMYNNDQSLIHSLDFIQKRIQV